MNVEDIVLLSNTSTEPKLKHAARRYAIYDRIFMKYKEIDLTSRPFVARDPHLQSYHIDPNQDRYWNFQKFNFKQFLNSGF